MGVIGSGIKGMVQTMSFEERTDFSLYKLDLKWIRPFPKSVALYRVLFMAYP